MKLAGLQRQLREREFAAAEQQRQQEELRLQLQHAQQESAALARSQRGLQRSESSASLSEDPVSPLASPQAYARAATRAAAAQQQQADTHAHAHSAEDAAEIRRLQQRLTELQQTLSEYETELARASERETNAAETARQDAHEKVRVCFCEKYAFIVVCSCVISLTLSRFLGLSLSFCFPGSECACGAWR